MAEAAKGESAKRRYWGRRIGEWQCSGQSQRVFCARHGLALSTFQWWRMRLRRTTLGAPASGFVPLPLIEPARAAVQIELRSGTRIRLEGEAAIRVLDALVGRVK